MDSYLKHKNESFQIACLNQSFRIIFARFRENLISSLDISFKLILTKTSKNKRIQIIKNIKDAYLLIYNEFPLHELP